MFPLANRDFVGVIIFINALCHVLPLCNPTKMSPNCPLLYVSINVFCGTYWKRLDATTEYQCNVFELYICSILRFYNVKLIFNQEKKPALSCGLSLSSKQIHFSN